MWLAGPMQLPQAVPQLNQAAMLGQRQHGVVQNWQQRPWHADSDVGSRRNLVLKQILLLFQQKKHGSKAQWNDQLPNFVKRLEDALYRTANSKEEYSDLTTLESRLQDVARRLVHPPQGPGSSSQAVPNGLPNMFSSQVNGGAAQMMQQAALPSSQQGVQNIPVSGPHMMGHQHMQAAAGMHHNLGVMSGGNMGYPGEMRADSNRTIPGMNPVNNHLPSGMLPLENLMASNPFQQQMPPNSTAGLAGHQYSHNGPMSSTLMSNGAPVLIRNNARDWSTQQPPMLQGGTGAQKVTINGAPPSQLSGNPLGGGVVGLPQAQGFVPNHPNPGMQVNPMIPVGNLQQPAPMVPVNKPTMPMPMANGPVPSGMIPMSAAGMVPTTSGMLNNSPLPANHLNVPQAQQTVPQQVPQMINVSGAPSLSPTSNPLDGGADASVMANRQQYIQKQQRWLLFLRHCAKCQQSETECQFNKSCRVGKDLWHHILNCSDPKCTYPRCVSSKDLLKHHQKCTNSQCPICTPVKEYVKRTRQNPGGVGGSSARPSASSGSGVDPLMQANAAASGPTATSGASTLVRTNSQLTGSKRTISAVLGDNANLKMMPINPSTPVVSPSSQGVKIEQEEQTSKRIKGEEGNILTKNTGTSLVEAFTEEQIEYHLNSVRQAAIQSKQQLPPDANPNDACSVCGLIRLTFEPPCLYCIHCGQRIKRGQTYYMTPAEFETKGYWCHGCFSENKGEKICFENQQLKKTDLAKKKNDEEMEEAWVQCDHCNAWVHQICGLFNKGRNNNDVHYLCPSCCLQGLRSGQRPRLDPRPQAMLEAKDLPECNLSRILEERVRVSLAEEHQMRAQLLNMPLDKVQTADGLTIRVVNSVAKKCEVKPNFYNTFRSDGYAEAFNYHQKVILLFQNLEGVDVCLYCMYVQEYGDDCPAPNRNCVYLSYIDSIKYFKPEINTAHGGAMTTTSLRTFVYHQILIGYLSFVKKRGFEQMYIWACPPLQGDDYILYCHPARQKTPRSDRLRAWYHDMLKRAKEEGIVKHVATLWDTYFEGGKDHRVEKCSVTAIPYLEGDYWPGEAENLLTNIQNDMRLSGKKEKAGSGANRKSGKGKRYGSGPATTDEQLMARLGDILGGNMKEDFIVVHLQEPCTVCRTHVLEGSLHKFVPSTSGSLLKPPPERRFEGIRLDTPLVNPIGPVSHFQMCTDCLNEEQRRICEGQKSRMPQGLSLTDLHNEHIKKQQVVKDVDLEVLSEFFDTRQNFLSLCQGNHYQFDSVRRAKHSSMMVLYHLHNPSAPAFACTCNSCNLEIEPGCGFRCTVCQDFDMCAQCHKQGSRHEHPLVAHTNFSNVDENRRRLTEKERTERMLQMQRTMQLLIHACNCTNPNCSSTSCRKVRQLFQHAVQCTQKVTGGCPLCKKMWVLLNMHAKTCTNSSCPVPRCRELKELRRRHISRQEDQRRMAYKAMLRQQGGG